MKSITKTIYVLCVTALISVTLPAQAYDAIANVTFNWATDGTEVGWDQGFPHVELGDISNTSYYLPQGNTSSTFYYNPDFATAEYFAAVSCPPLFQAQYACKIAQPPDDIFPVSGVGPGAAASGQLVVTDTTLIGTLSVIPTSDVGAGPQPGTTEATGYNIQPEYDGGPFKNVWYGIDTTATLDVALTGTFSASTWDITGGTVRISDPGFECAFADFSGVLCNTSTVIGGLSADGSHLSWGVDLDGGGPGTAMGEIEVRDGLNGSVIETISGVLASLTIDSNGNIVTNAGETRRAVALGACGTYIVYFESTGTVGCGGLYASALDIAGSVTPVPVPAAVWLFGSGLGLLGWLRRSNVSGPASPIQGRTASASSLPGPARP